MTYANSLKSITVPYSSRGISNGVHGSPSSPLMHHVGPTTSNIELSELESNSTAGSVSVKASRLDLIWDEKWFGANIDRSLSGTRAVPQSTGDAREYSDDSIYSRSPSLADDVTNTSFSTKLLGAARNNSVQRAVHSMVPPLGYLEPRPSSLPSQPVPAMSPRLPFLNPDGEKLPMQLGTWAQRQVRMCKTPSPEELMARKDTSDSSSLVSQGLRDLVARREAAAAAAQLEAVDDDQVAGAAWRWRFARKWHAEQTREIDPEDDQGDVTDEALHLLQAGGAQGWNMQMNVARTNSEVGSSSLVRSCLLKSGSLVGFDTAMLSEEDSMGGPGQMDMEATKELSALHRYVEKLALQQRELEARAQEQWRMATAAGQQGGGGVAWIGSLLPAVQVDETGSFSFAVIKVCDQAGRQRMVVHGSNLLSESDIVERAKQKLRQLSGNNILPADLLVVIGGGVMQWSMEDHQKCLRIHSAYSSEGLGGNLGTSSKPSDIINLAAALVRQNLPTSYRIIAVE
ncbi:hypothetical protein CEUSTIGMA_g1368.t1 [Chlamydomonas eustigma]|uniref:Uncharacterized protein n=1 Tax=Chlamydomonas eustigma TaxID=1157962 RepID=A0A250WSV2_9CHLO|nr:hypothetical protein CEUSTIGMA_g1368.t1 [Chlamydomonas eustigma]|eukprot:GAX73918.1 hypothetical protein CEUSTIGMA_g1368.t1 [Chlamydomonas eustigma]